MTGSCGAETANFLSSHLFLRSLPEASALGPYARIVQPIHLVYAVPGHAFDINPRRCRYL